MKIRTNRDYYENTASALQTRRAYEAHFGRQLTGTYANGWSELEQALGRDTATRLIKAQSNDPKASEPECFFSIEDLAVYEAEGGARNHSAALAAVTAQRVTR